MLNIQGTLQWYLDPIHVNQHSYQTGKSCFLKKTHVPISKHMKKWESSGKKLKNADFVHLHIVYECEALAR